MARQIFWGFLIALAAFAGAAVLVLALGVLGYLIFSVSPWFALIPVFFVVWYLAYQGLKNY